MQIVINIPDEQVKKSLEESKYIHEDEGEKGFVNIALLYTNGQLEFVDVTRKTDFYSCEYRMLPEGYGDLVDYEKPKNNARECGAYAETTLSHIKPKTIIEADKSESEDK